MKKQHTTWTLGYTDTLEAVPQERVEAFVPGEVQRIWGKAKNMPDYNFDRNYLEYAFMEDKFWHFESRVAVEDLPGTEPVLIAESIDYYYTVRVNGETLCNGEGMFTPVKVSLQKYRGQTVNVNITVHPVPKIEGANGRENAAKSVKPPVSYGWDWHPRFVVSGMAGDVYVAYLPTRRIEEADFLYTLSEDLQDVDFEAKIETNTEQGSVKVSLISEAGETVAENSFAAGKKCGGMLRFAHPQLWWCRGQGEQHFYTYRVQLFAADGTLLDEKTRRVGFRRAKLVLNDNDFYDMGFPKTQAYSPITMELNGRRIFGKGTNFVPIDMCYSLMTREAYRTQLELVADCNMNILRMWGGGLVNKEDFFELCDDMGIMVWQEFPLACNLYPDDPHYLRMLDKEAVSIVKRLKSHPSVVMYCGGNELFNEWSGMTNQSLALRLLDRVCIENDPWTPYNMTSPLYGMGHGCYLNITTNGVEAVTDFVERFRTAYTEFGAPSPAPLDYIRQYIKEEDLYRVEEGTAWEDHHALNSWGDRDTWFRPQEIAAFYGKDDTLEETIAHGLELQGESYKGMFEEARRKWPKTSMAINWCFNEPWPCFANNTLVMYPAVKRPAFDRVKDALRDRMLSVRLYKLRYTPGEEVTAEVFVLNSLPETLPGGKFRMVLCNGGEETELFTGSFADAAGNTSTPCGKFTFTVPANCEKQFTLRVEAENAALGGQYLLYRLPQEKG